MKLLKDRKFAILITVVVAVLATLFGVYRTSSRGAGRVEAMFFDGVFLQERGFTEPGIESHLENSADSVLSLTSVFGNYPELADKNEALVEARRNLLGASGVAGKSDAFFEMWKMYDSLLDAAESVSLSERDSAAVSQLSESFRGALIAIRNSAYNDKVIEYRDGRSIFTVLIGGLVAAKIPSSFGAIYTIEKEAPELFRASGGT